MKYIIKSIQMFLVGIIFLLLFRKLKKGGATVTTPIIIKINKIKDPRPAKLKTIIILA